MNVLARVDDYVHTVRAGSEVTLHLMLLWLAERGHDVQVVAEAAGRGRQEEEVDGLPILTNPNAGDIYEAYEWADVVVTQQAITRRCIEECAGRAPIVFVCHVRGQDSAFLRPGEASLVVFNSYWMALESRHLGPTLVVQPPVHRARYETTDESGREGGILQVNLSEGKGGPLFWWLARHLHHRRFLAAQGTWGTQQTPQTVPPNVVLLPKTADVREHYARATVVLMPSKKETYGRVALEAAWSGIPAIVSPTPGLQEAMGAAALYADPADPKAWVNHLRALEDPDYYLERSAAALAWAEKREAESRVQLDAWECALLQTAADRWARVWAFASEPHYVDHAWSQLACVDPRYRGPLAVPSWSNQEPALKRAWGAGAVVLRLPEVRSASQRKDVLAAMNDPDGSGSVVVVVSERDRMAAESWFPKRVVRGEHGAGQSYSGLSHHSFPGGPGHAGCLAATAPNESVAARIKAAHCHLAVAAIGCPRLIALTRALRFPEASVYESDLLVLSFRREGTETDECQELASAWYHYRDLEPPPGWRLALHLHPRAKGNQVEKHFRARGWEVIEEFSEVLQRAAVYACDNSSAAVEWHHVRQGQLVLLDCPLYRRWQNHGLRFWDMLEWKGVYIAEGPKELGAFALAARDAGAVGESPWYAETQPARLELWLRAMLRPDADVVRVFALQTFEGQHGRVVRGHTARVPKEYAESVESRGLARILTKRENPEVDCHRRPGEPVGHLQSHLRWTEAGLWRGM